MAARKRVDPLKAKEAKQKKIAIGGMAVLCLLLFIQGPKTLKMLKGPEPTPAAAPAAPNPVAPAPGATAPAAGTVGAAAPGDVVDLSALADSDVAPVAEEGQLVSFERFASKDPFVPQAVATPAPAPAAPADDAPGAGCRRGQLRATPIRSTAASRLPHPRAPRAARAAAHRRRQRRRWPRTRRSPSTAPPRDVEEEATFPADAADVRARLACEGRQVGRDRDRRWLATPTAARRSSSRSESPSHCRTPRTERATSSSCSRSQASRFRSRSGNRSAPVLRPARPGARPAMSARPRRGCSCSSRRGYRLPRG